MKPGTAFIGGLVLGLGIAAIAILVLRARMMKALRGDRPLPGGMDGKVEAFTYSLLDDLMASAAPPANNP